MSRAPVAVRVRLPRDEYEQALHLYREGRDAECQALCLKLLEREPKRGELWQRVAHVAERQGRHGDALLFFERAAALLANPAEVHANIGVLRQRAGDLDGALAHLQRAMAGGVRHPALLGNVGAVLARRAQMTAAIATLREALERNPHLASARTNLGYALVAVGHTHAGVAELERAAAEAPGFLDAQDNLLFARHYDDRARGADLLGDARRYGDLMARACAPRPRAPAAVDAGRPLRVGLVSPDLRRHPVATFLAPLLEARDPTRVRYFAYANLARPDEVSERLRRQCDGWTGIHGVPDEEVCARIARDGIDVLVDLAGHTEGNRLPLFARRPAPVQVAYLGYPGSTGLATIDFRLTDAWADPPGMTDAQFTERLVRLAAGFLCYGPPDEAPPPARAPGRPFTFGSFNNLAKASPAALALWRRVLDAVPGSRLLVKSGVLVDEAVAAGFRDVAAAAGIAPDRLELRPPLQDFREHLASYADVDVALDTFPYHGTTTTCEALWMGVPVVTLAGETHVSRVGASVLAQVGLDELVAASADDYVRVASALAGDGARLDELRRTLRARVATSPLCDARLKARQLEAALWACAGLAAAP